MKGLFLIADLGAWILAGSTFGPCLSALLGLLGIGALFQHGQGLAGAAVVSSQQGLPPCSYCGLSVPTGTPHTCAGRAGFGLSLCLPTRSLNSRETQPGWVTDTPHSKGRGFCMSLEECCLPGQFWGKNTRLESKSSRSCAKNSY